MLSRKINAVLGLLATCLLLYHAVFLAVWMLSKGTISAPNGISSRVMVGVVALHAFISIEQGISAHAGTEKVKCKSYPRLNAPTLIQRMSGILIIILAGLHIAGALGAMHPPKAIHAVVPTLFFAVTLAHVAVSASKAFITLGIGNAVFVKAADIAIKAISALTLLADVVGFYMYLV